MQRARSTRWQLLTLALVLGTLLLLAWVSSPQPGRRAAPQAFASPRGGLLAEDSDDTLAGSAFHGWPVLASGNGTPLVPPAVARWRQARPAAPSSPTWSWLLVTAPPRGPPQA